MTSDAVDLARKELERERRLDDAHKTATTALAKADEVCDRTNNMYSRKEVDDRLERIAVSIADQVLDRLADKIENLELRLGQLVDDRAAEVKDEIKADQEKSLPGEVRKVIQMDDDDAEEQLKKLRERRYAQIRNWVLIIFAALNVIWFVANAMNLWPNASAGPPRPPSGIM
ncbi:MAG: hypothetical protein AAF583_01665 [Pseudomonadota bacterium]